MRLLSKYRAQRSRPRLFTALSTPIRKYRDVFRLVGRTLLSVQDAFVPPKSARGPTAVQGDRPTSAVQALISSVYCEWEPLASASRAVRFPAVSAFYSFSLGHKVRHRRRSRYPTTMSRSASEPVWLCCPSAFRTRAES